MADRPSSIAITRYAHNIEQLLLEEHQLVRMDAAGRHLNLP